MGDEKIIELLEDVRVMVASNKAENFKNGKEFNVFYIQRTASDELRVCRFLRELLDPNGSHGQGDIFLRRFFTSVLNSDFPGINDCDYKNARVVCEEAIDNFRRIDIVIHIGRHLIPIEVKIYADDQYKQCMDYYNYAVKTDPSTKLYYLTLDGHEPSEDSKCTLLDSQYKCLSFAEDILKWLDECIGAEKIEQIYSVREVLIQFRNVLKDLTGKQGGRLEMEIKEKIAASQDSIIAAIKIENTLPEVKIDKMYEVFEAIQEHMIELGYTELLDCYHDEARQYYVNGKKSWPSLNIVLPVEDNNVVGKVVLRFEIGERLYYGVCPWNGKNNWDSKKEDYIKEYIYQNILPENVAHRATKNWYWWDYLNDDSEANYRYCNSDYFRLFDVDGFKEYMESAFSKIDKWLKH